MRPVRLYDRDKIESRHVAALEPGTQKKFDEFIARNACLEGNAKVYVDRLAKIEVKDLLVMDVKAMRDLVSQIDSVLPSNRFYAMRAEKHSEELVFKQLNAELKKVFDYDGFSKLDSGWTLSALAQSINRTLRVCPYCNAETVYAYEIENYRNRKKPKILKSAFDHFFPEARYPFLALSLYNLIPSCTRCNSGYKGDEWEGLVDTAHPYADVRKQEVEEYDEDMHKEMKFRVLPNRMAAFSCCSADDIGGIAFSERSKGTFHKGRKWENLFCISETYSELYKSDAAEAMARAICYPESYVKELRSRLDSVGLPTGKLNKVIYGSSMNPDDINKTRMGKLIQDVVETYRPELAVCTTNYLNSQDGLINCKV